MAGKLRVVIVGGVATGPKAAARARRCDPAAEITLVEQGEYISYGGCGLAYFVGGLVPKMAGLMTTLSGQVRDVEYFALEKDIAVRTRTRAEGIDRARKELAVRDLASGESWRIPYDRLVLATGAMPAVPPVPGIDLGNVFKLRTPADALALKALVEKRGDGRYVVVGGGLIGLEAAEALSARGEVTVVEMADHLLPGVLDADMAVLLERHLEREGLDVRLGCRLERLEANEEGNVCRVVAGGEEIEADAVVLGTGVRPNVELAKAAGLALGPTGAIAVDEYLQTSDPDIYAGGDCVENTHLVSGQKVCCPQGSTANKHGRVIGSNVVGGREKFAGVLGTVAVQVMEFNVGCTGLGEEQARRLGYDVVTALVPTVDCAHYFPTHAAITVKLVADAATRRLLGAQVAGPGEAVKRVDVAATALTLGATVDRLAEVDLGYAPPYATAIDPIAHAANLCRNKLDGLARTCSVRELAAMLASGEPLTLVDVRTAGEVKRGRSLGHPSLHIPLGELRERLGEIPADRPVVLFCALGMRSYEAQRALADAGFPAVSFLEGGIAAWTGR